MNNLEIIKSERSSESLHQKENYWQKIVLTNPLLNMKSTTFEQTMKKFLCSFDQNTTEFAQNTTKFVQNTTVFAPQNNTLFA